MTYFQFHLVFLLPPLFLLWWYGRKHAFLSSAKAIWSLVVITIIAFVYTTPWDNFLVLNGVWGYGEGRVLGTLGYVPVEEYIFFILQPLLTGLWLYRFLPVNPQPAQVSRYAGTAHWMGTLVYTYLSLVGLLMLQYESTYYMALILVWACPVLAFQWAYGGDHLWTNKSTFLWAVMLPTLYLWLADRLAIGMGIWYISEQFTTGFHLFGLPIEEALFFLITNLLVVQGLMLSVHKWDAFGAYFQRKRAALISRYIERYNG